MSVSVRHLRAAPIIADAPGIFTGHGSEHDVWGMFSERRRWQNISNSMCTCVWEPTLVRNSMRSAFYITFDVIGLREQLHFSSIYLMTLARST